MSRSDLKADFAAKRIAALRSSMSPRRGREEIVLDTKGIEIQSVADAEGQALQISVGGADPIWARR